MHNYTLNPIFLFLFFISSGVTANADEIGRTDSVVNKVFAGGLNHRLENGERINLNEKIITGADSAAKIIFVDGSQLLLGEETRIVLNKLNYETEKNKVTGSFNLLNGVIKFDTGGKSMDFDIRTHNTSIAMSGTSFEVFTSKTMTEVLCHDGILQISYKNGVHELQPGKSVFIDNAGDAESKLTTTREMAQRVAQMLSMLEQVVVLDQSGKIKKKEKEIKLGKEASFSGKNLELKLLKGKVKIKLRPDLAPIHVRRIKELALMQFYDGLTFFNVKPGYVVETGSPTDAKLSGSGKKIPAEFSDTPFIRGTVGMTRLANKPDTGDSQFFVSLGRAPELDKNYTVWGQVVSGIKFLDMLAPGTPPKKPDRIISLRLVD